MARVAAVNQLPIGSPVYGCGYRIERQFEDIRKGLPNSNHSQTVTAGYIDALRIPTPNGRDFTDADRTGPPPVVIVSRSMARCFGPQGDAIGKRIGYPWESPWLTVVGIVADVRADSLRDTAAAAVYIPFLQRARSSAGAFSIVVRTTGDSSAIGNELRGVVAGVDRSAAVRR